MASFRATTVLSSVAGQLNEFLKVRSKHGRKRRRQTQTTSQSAEVLDPRILMSAAPVGHVDGVNRDGIVHGWAFDRDSPGRSTRLHVYVDGRHVASANTQFPEAMLIVLYTSLATTASGSRYLTSFGMERRTLWRCTLSTFSEFRIHDWQDQQPLSGLQRHMFPKVFWTESMRTLLSMGGLSIVTHRGSQFE